MICCCWLPCAYEKISQPNKQEENGAVKALFSRPANDRLRVFSCEKKKSLCYDDDGHGVTEQKGAKPKSAADRLDILFSLTLS